MLQGCLKTRSKECEGGCTHLKRVGSSQPANSQKRALGESSPGRPLNFVSSSSSVLNLNQYPCNSRAVVRTYGFAFFSHFTTSSQASSFKKLWMCTIVSTCSSGVSQPLRTRAL